MKKKGFTLIELLAVIVILAIIALIATPLVLKYIETSRINSKKVSTQNYIRGLENALVTYTMNKKGQEYPDGCYEIDTLNTDLDISMKGDIPTEGKICIDNNRIKSAIVKYDDNRIVKYENEKTTISDEETYESFNSVSSYIIDTNVEFAFNSQINFNSADLKLDFNKFEVPSIYTVTITDKSGNEQSGDLISMKVDGSKYYLINKKMNFFYITDGNVGTLASFDSSMVGEYNVKVAKSNKEYIPHLLTVSSNDYIKITSSEFIDGEATFKIIGSDNDINYEETQTISKGDNTFEHIFISYPNVLEYLNSGKTFRVEITQNGKTYVLGGSNFNKVENTNDIWGCDEDNYYYWGNNDIEQSPYGC